MRRAALVVGVVSTLACSRLADASVWPGAQDRIVAGLESSDVAERRNAALRLAELPAALGRKLAARALRDADAEVRLAAARMAIALRVERAGDEVVEWLQDSDPRARLAACEVIQAAPTSTSVAGLGRVLSDARPEVRAAAALALGGAGEADAVGPLLGHLDDPSTDVRLSVTRALGRVADRRAAIPLVSKLQDPEVAVRAAAARALGNLRDPSAVPSLELALRDRDGSVKVAVVEALGHLGAPSSVPVMARLLGPPPAEPDDARNAQGVRVAAATALSRIGTDEALRTLVAELAVEGPLLYADDPSAMVRRALARGGKRAVDALLPALESTTSSRHATAIALALGAAAGAPERAAVSDAIVRAGRRGAVGLVAAMRALERLGEPTALPFVLEQLGAAEEATRECAVSVASSLLDPTLPDGRAIDVARERLARAELSVAERAALYRLLGRTGAPRAASILVAAWTDLAGRDDRRSLGLVAEAIATALGELGASSPSVDEALLSGLRNDSERVRTAAARALGRVGSEAAARTLLERLRGAAEVDRVALGLALSGAFARVRGPEVVTLARETLPVVSGVTRDALLEGLGRSPARAALDALAEVAKSSDVDDRRKIAEALVARTDARALTVELSRDPDEGVRANALWALGRAGYTDAVEVASAATRDADGAVAANATLAMARLGGRSVTGKLCATLEDPRPYVRHAALTGLLRSGGSCADGVLRGVLSGDPVAMVRAAAARALVRARMEAKGANGTVDPEHERRDRVALARCVEDDRDARVSASCRGASGEAPSSSTTHDLHVFVVPNGGSEPVARAPFALVLPDLTVRLGVADRRGAVFEPGAPDGQVELAVPAALVR